MRYISLYIYIYIYTIHSIYEYIGHVGKLSVSEYSDRVFKPRLHQHVVSLKKTLNLNCFSRLSCEYQMRTPHKGCLFSAMISPEKVALKSMHIYLY